MTKLSASEAEILQGILDYLQRVRHIYCWRNNSGAATFAGGRFVRYGKVGSSDILGLLPSGRFLAIEVKAENGRVSPEQYEFFSSVNLHGGLAIIARSLEDVITALDKRK